MYSMRLNIVLLVTLSLVGCAKSEMPVQCKGYATFQPVPNDENVKPKTASIKLDKLRQNANGTWDFHRINGKGMTSQSAWMKPTEYDHIECTQGPVEQLMSLKTRKGQPVTML